MMGTEHAAGTEPVRYRVVDNWMPAALPDVPPRSWYGWEAHYDNDVERGKYTVRDLTRLPRFASALAWVRDRLPAEAEALLGHPVEDDPTLHGGGLHVMAPGGVLGCHLDYDRHPRLPDKRRAVNLIVFAHGEWRAEWGGQFYLANPLGVPVVTVDPLPGRAVLFECNDMSYHGVLPVAGPLPRVSLAVYGLTAATAANTRQRAMFLPHRPAKPA